MTTEIQKEIDAIKAILVALETLAPKAQNSVLNYVVTRLGMNLQNTSIVNAPAALQQNPLPQQREVVAAAPKISHIKELVDQKQPKSANEMATLVAYYLAEVAPENERKATIGTKDIETYFKIASFRLPKEARYTLTNAKTSGYLDQVGAGEYKLNAVGHNLVVHNMPRKESSGAGPRRRARTKKSATKKIATNKSK